MNEFEIIEKYFSKLTNKSKAAADLKDDVAVINNIGKNQQLILSKDLMVQDVHFKSSDGGFNIAYKLLASNLSDLAASGAKPLYYMLGFSKNDSTNEKFISQFCQGLKEVSNQYQISLIGGDTVKAKDQLFFSLTIFGQTPKGQNLKRSNAENKDLIMVSGNIGDAFLGLQISEKNKKDFKISTSDQKYLLSRHLNPTPRINLGQNLLKQKLSTCAIDISDGLFADLSHICKASNLSAEIYQNQIPLSNPAKSFLQKNPDFSINDLASGGDDYELIFTIKEKDLEKTLKLGKKINVKISKIGQFKSSKNHKTSINLLDQNHNQIKIAKYGYLHF